MSLPGVFLAPGKLIEAIFTKRLTETSGSGKIPSLDQMNAPIV